MYNTHSLCLFFQLLLTNYKMNRSLRHKIEHDIEILHSLVIKVRPSNISSYIKKLSPLQKHYLHLSQVHLYSLKWTKHM